MTDKETLEEVYRKLEFAVGGDAVAIRRFIEQEWQKRDELEMQRNEMFNLADDGQMNSVDAIEIERHVGLEIGEDGTVTGIK